MSKFEIIYKFFCAKRISFCPGGRGRVCSQWLRVPAAYSADMVSSLSLALSRCSLGLIGLPMVLLLSSLLVGSVWFVEKAARQVSARAAHSTAGTGQCWQDHTHQASGWRGGCGRDHSNTGMSVLNYTFWSDLYHSLPSPLVSHYHPPLLLCCPLAISIVALRVKGFNVKTVDSKGLRLNVWDIGGTLLCVCVCL